MANKRANTLEPDAAVRLLQTAVSTTAIPESAKLCVLLSFKAGLRAGEIAKIRVRDLTNAGGKPGRDVHVFSAVGKGARERSIPMHPEISQALIEFRRAYPRATHIALGRRGKRPPYELNANALTAWFHRLYKRAGFQGCSSHTGRRTFATTLARSYWRHGKSIVDVQRLLGHAQLNTTESYIDPSESVVDLIASL